MSSIKSKLMPFRDCLNRYLIDWDTGTLYNLKGELIDGVQLKFKNKKHTQRVCCNGQCSEGAPIHNLAFIFK